MPYINLGSYGIRGGEEEISRKLREYLILPSLADYGTLNNKTAARIARECCKSISLYSFSESSGDLLAHAAVVEMVCEILGVPGVANELIIPTILNAESIAKDQIIELKNTDIPRYLELLTTSLSIRESCRQADNYLKALKKWVGLERTLPTAHCSLLQEYHKLFIIANVIGVDDIIMNFEGTCHTWTYD